MRKINNIKEIIESLDNSELKGKKYKYRDVKIEFFKFAKMSVSDFPKEEKKCKTNEEKENLKKYKKFGTSKYKNLQKLFLEKLKNENILYCCYCGKNELIFLKQKEQRLYDVEHFLPRSKYPDLAVNLLNWLPVCSSCNSRLKGTKDPLENKKEIFHPYLGFLNIFEKKSLDEKYSFCKKDKKGRKLIYESNHSDFFSLEDIYLSSNSTEYETNNIRYIKENILVDKQNSKKYGIPFDFNDSLKRHSKNYPEKEQDILKFSNGKLKKDLIENLQI